MKGDTAHPFYKWAKDVLGEPAEPVWNFHKILVGKDGKLIRAFGPRTEPLDDEVVGAVKAALLGRIDAFVRNPVIPAKAGTQIQAAALAG